MKRYTYNDIYIGMEESFQAIITEELMEQFQCITGDSNPLHCDEAYAKSRGKKGRVGYGMLTASFLSTLAGMYLPGERSLIQEVNVKFLKPVYIGEELKIQGIVKEKHDVFQRIELKVCIYNANQEKILRGTMQIGVE